MLLEHALDHEHDIRPAGVVFVEHQRNRVLQRPREQAFAELGHLQSVAQHDRIAPDEVDAADVRVEVDADARPVEPGGDLFDVGRFAGAVIALDHDPTVERESGENRQGRIGIEDVAFIDVGHARVGLGEGRYLPVDIDPEHFARIDGRVRRGEDGALG